jgi:hypothetical protein
MRKTLSHQAGVPRTLRVWTEVASRRETFEKKAEREKSRMPNAKQSVKQAVAHKEPEKTPKA